MADFRFTPDLCLLAIARKAFNHFEPDDRLAIFQEVIRRWAEIVEKVSAERTHTTDSD